MSTSDLEAQRKIVNRLRRARGQLDAVIRAAEAGDSCRDVITQLSAVTSALNKAGYAIIATAMKDCVADPEGAERTDTITVEELEKLFLTLA